MRHWLALAVAASLVAGAGCVSRGTYDRDLQQEQARTARAQSDLEQTKQDLRKTQELLAAKAPELLAKTNALTDAQNNLRNQRERGDRLQADLAKAQTAAKSDAEKMKWIQDQLDAALARFKVLGEVVQKQNETIKELGGQPEKFNLPPMPQPPAPPKPAATPPSK